MKKLTLACLALALTGNWAPAAPNTTVLGPLSKIARDLVGANPLAPVQVIVQWKQAPSLLQHQEVTSLGGQLISTLPLINGAVYTLPAGLVNILAALPDIIYISPDRGVAAKLDYTAAAINAGAAWSSNYTGAGIGVAVIDSGINADPNFGNRIPAYYDFVGGRGQDQYGHGQHVAGIIAASGQTSNCLTCTRSLKGIAPGATLLNARVLDQNGTGQVSNVITAIQGAIALKSKYNIRVINLSLGQPVYESYTLDPLCQAVEAAWKAGIVVVVAAGNDGRDNSFGSNGYGTITSPGNDPYVITVGAMKTEATYNRADDLIASYSSKGPTMVDQIVKPDLVAPGNMVVSLQAANSTLVNEYPANIPPVSYYEYTLNVPLLGALPKDTEYFSLSGTSMAAAVVSGAVADLLQAQPSLTPDQVKARLMQTAYSASFPASSTAYDPTTGQTYTDYYDPFTVGAGYLDIAAALADTTVATGNAMSPTATFNSATGTLTFLFAEGSVWNSSAVWSTSSIWDTSSVWGTATVGSASSVWSSSSVWSTSSVWSSSSVWSTSSVWSSSSVWSTSTPSAQSSTVLINGEP